MNIIFNLLASHLITVIEKDLEKALPEGVNFIENEIKVLIQRLESYISSKNPNVAKVVNPILDASVNTADRMMDAAENAALNG